MRYSNDATLLFRKISGFMFKNLQCKYLPAPEKKEHDYFLEQPTVF